MDNTIRDVNAPGARRSATSFFAVRRGRIEMYGRGVQLPARRRWRVSIGVGLILCGLLGFLPILGFWMVPLGLLVLSIDIAIVRRLRRRSAVRWGRRGQGARPPATAAGETAAALVDASLRGAGQVGRD